MMSKEVIQGWQNRAKEELESYKKDLDVITGIGDHIEVDDMCTELEHEIEILEAIMNG